MWDVNVQFFFYYNFDLFTLIYYLILANILRLKQPFNRSPMLALYVSCNQLVFNVTFLFILFHINERLTRN